MRSRVVLIGVLVAGCQLYDDGYDIENCRIYGPPEILPHASGDTTRLVVGDTTTLRYQISYYCGGYGPEATTYVKADWETDDPRIATVSQTGVGPDYPALLAGVRPGSTTVKVTPTRAVVGEVWPPMAYRHVDVRSAPLTAR